MMKSVLFLLAGLCFLAQAAQRPPQVTDKTVDTRQRSIYELFWLVDQPTVYQTQLYYKARTFNIVENVHEYSDQEAVTRFLELLKHGMLPRGQIFTIMDPQQHEQAVVLTRVLYSAKTFNMFYDTAVWARVNVNEQMFIYALSVAIIHRPDTRTLKIPPLYKVLPHLFFNQDVIQKVYKIALGGEGLKKTASGVDYYVVPANYSSGLLTKQNVFEQKLNYFTEDIGQNNFYFLMNHDFPPYLNGSTFGAQSRMRGEYYFWLHNQLLTRYYLERLSHGLGEIKEVSVEKPIVFGYHPMMQFPNGIPFPTREAGADVSQRMHRHVHMLKDIHTRISNAIDLGYVEDTEGKRIDIYTKDGLNILGNIVQGNADSVNKRFYGSLDALARQIYGFGLHSDVKYQSVPSALEMYSTSMRDPVFYSMYKNILAYYSRYKENLPKYTREELLFHDVQIESVNVDRLMTYFDYFDTVIYDGLTVRSRQEQRNTIIRARQHRLNHKPFTYHIVVNSQIDTKAAVRLFLGPKYDIYGNEVDFEQSYINFLELDRWMVDLHRGANTIERSSHESVYVVPDETESEMMHSQVTTMPPSTVSFTNSTRRYGYPDRLLLPKGTKEGMTYKLFVMISPLDKMDYHEIETSIWGKFLFDGHSMGYPLDRPIDLLHFLVPNMYMKDVTIYHKEMEELNVTA